MNYSTPDISPLWKHLWTVLLVTCGLLLFATPGEAHEPAGVEGELQAEDGCEQPCPGESDDDGECEEGCDFCGCCSTMPPALLPAVPTPLTERVFSSSSAQPPPSRRHAGFGLRLFKPPQHLSA